MADRPDPYVKRSAGDIIRADDWNEAQVQTREDLARHDHAGGHGAPVPREGIREKAIDGSRIDPAASVTVQDTTPVVPETPRRFLRVRAAGTP